MQMEEDFFSDSYCRKKDQDVDLCCLSGCFPVFGSSRGDVLQVAVLLLPISHVL